MTAVLFTTMSASRPFSSTELESGSLVEWTTLTRHLDLIPFLLSRSFPLWKNMIRPKEQLRNKQKNGILNAFGWCNLKSV